MWMTTLGVFALGTALAFGLGAYLCTRGRDQHRHRLPDLQLHRAAAPPIEQIRTQLQDLQQASAGIARVEELLRDAARGWPTAPGAALPPGALAVEFDDVTFGYEADEPGAARPVASPGAGRGAGRCWGAPAAARRP